MNKNTVIMTTVGLVTGVAEALLYYNLGASAGQKFALKMPPAKEFLQTVGIVLVTSVITAGISSLIESGLEDEKKQTVTT